MDGDIRAGFEADDYEQLNVKLPGLIADLKKRGVPYGVMRYVDHGLDNSHPERGVSDSVKRWNDEHDDIKCIVATESMFFDALKSDCRDMDVATVYGELPHTDYTTLSLSNAQITALNNHTKHKLHRLEKLNTLLFNNEFGKDFLKIYKDIILYDEHCFGMENYGYETDYNSAIKNNYAYRAARDTDILRKNIEKNAIEESANEISVFSLSGIKGDSIATKLVCRPYDEMEANSEYVSQGRDTILLQVDSIDDYGLPCYGLADLIALKHTNHKVLRYTYAIPATANLSADTYKRVKNISKRKSISDSCMENDYYIVNIDDSGKVSVFDKELNKYISDKSCSMGEVKSRNIETN